MKVPTCEEYKTALKSITISDKQKKMLEAHFKAHNRTITYTKLTNAAGHEGHYFANRWYGQLGLDLGKAINFEFADAENRPGKKFRSSAIGMEFSYPSGDEFDFVMHHELAKAIASLGWFQ